MNKSEKVFKCLENHSPITHMLNFNIQKNKTSEQSKKNRNRVKMFYLKINSFIRRQVKKEQKIDCTHVDHTS